MWCWGGGKISGRELDKRTCFVTAFLRDEPLASQMLLWVFFLLFSSSAAPIDYQVFGYRNTRINLWALWYIKYSRRTNQRVQRSLVCQLFPHRFKLYSVGLQRCAIGLRDRVWLMEAANAVLQSGHLQKALPEAPGVFHSHTWSVFTQKPGRCWCVFLTSATLPMLLHKWWHSHSVTHHWLVLERHSPSERSFMNNADLVKKKDWCDPVLKWRRIRGKGFSAD